MKKLFRYGMLTCLVATFIATVPAPVLAQGPTPAATSTPVAIAASDLITFSQLGVKEKTLRGPFDSTSFSLNLPGDWRVNSEARIELGLSVLYAGSGAPLRSSVSGATLAKGTRPTAASLEISFDGTTIASIRLEKEGEQTIMVAIPAELLANPARLNRHRVQLALNSAEDCDFDWQTTVVVRATSRVVLPHDFVSPSTDLRLLPRPIYQGSFDPETALIVVPDKPTASELGAALSIAAGFGRMTGGKLRMMLLPVGRLTRDLQSTSNLIFVGKANDLPLLDGVTLPAAAGANGFNAKDAQAEDGIVQMAISPWNPFRLILVAGGNNDVAVSKAGQALSTGIAKVGARPNLALVSEVRPDLNLTAFTTDLTLAALGYPNTTLQDFGTNIVEYRFSVPSGQTLAGEAYFDLAFNHSAMIDFEKSGMVVTLNDEPIGSARFTDETAKLGNVRIPIPRTAIRPGINRLAITTDLFPRFVCIDPRLSLLWVSIRSGSLLHLPLAPAQNKDARIIDLTGYPALLAQHPSLSTTGFVVSADDPVAWNVAAQIAFDIGNNSAAGLADLLVVFPDSVPETVRKTRDLVIVGKPTTLPILNDLREVLPAPFEPGSDLAIERNVRVVYHIPPGTSVGYLELMNAPWNSERVILGILGTDEAGVRSAGAALTTPRLRTQLGGNYSFVNGEQVVIGDSRFGPTVAGIAPTAVPSAIQATPSPELPDIQAKPAWILPALGTSIGLMGVVLIIAGITSWVQRPRLK